MSSLDLALIGNGTIGALINPQGEVVWACFPHFDGDPMFATLLRPSTPPPEHGFFRIELIDLVSVTQAYVGNTPMLRTCLTDAHGGAIEILDFAPRFEQHERLVAPMMLVRQIRPLAGSPRICVRVRPSRNYGTDAAPVSFGSHHIRYHNGELTLRLATTLPVSAILDETVIRLDTPATLILGPDEVVPEALDEAARRFRERTTTYWQGWVRSLAIPFEWQDDVIRAAITLKLNTFEDTGAIIAAMTTSVPEAAHSGRNWDYRYCWLRDAYFVIDALNRLGATHTMERYLRYIVNLVAAAPDGQLRPVYTIGGSDIPDERIVDTLPGYRGMGPVRVGNQARDQVQHDVYGAAILGVCHVFFDHRLVHRGDAALFRQIEGLGEQAARRFDQPDAGIWELRGSARVHTFSAMMCWAACDRLARIAERIDLADRAAYWRAEADRIRERILAEAWNPAMQSFVSTFGGDRLDAALLHMQAIHFIAPTDPRYIATVEAIGRTLRRGDLLLRYDEEDDFGHMESAFLVCSFWYVDALAAIGRRDEARQLFEVLLRLRNRHGLYAEDIHPVTGEPWGNFVQTYSMVGLIDCALRLSASWSEAI